MWSHNYRSLFAAEQIARLCYNRPRVGGSATDDEWIHNVCAAGHSGGQRVKEDMCMLLNAVARSRLSLVTLLVFLTVSLSLSYGSRSNRNDATNSDIRWSENALSGNSGVASDVAIMQLIAELQHRPATPAERRHVVQELNNPRWHLTRAAWEALKDQPDARGPDISLHILRRAAAETSVASTISASFDDWQECLATVHEVLDRETDSRWETPARQESLERILAGLLANCRDASVRAHALRCLAHRQPDVRQELLAMALDDPSERVCLVALEIVESSARSELIPHIQPLASSPRPDVRGRAASALRALGSVAESDEYGECVMAAAIQLADRLLDLGVDASTYSVAPGGRGLGALDAEEFSRSAEDYLDQALPANEAEFSGVLYLALAARLQLRKLTLRLWDREIVRADSDDELVGHGLEAVARAEWIDGLIALRRGDETAGRERLARVSGFADVAAPHSRLRAYAVQANRLAASLRRADQPPAEHAQATIAVQEILGSLDLARADQWAEARRRLDAWCGLDASRHAGVRESQARPLAN
jgi:hypothetical protein